jgi:hypothetical protein
MGCRLKQKILKITSWMPQRTNHEPNGVPLVRTSMQRPCVLLICLLMITTTLAGCIDDKGRIDGGGIVIDDGDDSGNQTNTNNSTTEEFVGSVIFETPGEAVHTGVSVPFIYYEDSIFYLYMCNGTEGHHYSTSTDGLNYTSPQKTGIGGCGLNFVKLNDGTYRLYSTTKVTLENGTQSINSTSAVFTNLTDFAPTNRVDDDGTNAQSTGEPCNDFMGTPSVVRLNESDDSVRLYFSCSEPSHMAGFTSATDGINFADSDGILLNQAIDIEVHDIGDGYRVFYTLMNPDVHPELTPFHPQEIMTAVSDDGLNWVVEGMVANVSTVAEGMGVEIDVLADPSAIQLDDGSWRIFFGSASEKTDDHGGIYSLRWTP